MKIVNIVNTEIEDDINDDINSFNNIQSNMNLRRKLIQKILDKNEFVLSLTSFPLLGCKQFTYPNHLPAEIKTKYDSLFYSNNIG